MRRYEMGTVRLCSVCACGVLRCCEGERTLEGEDDAGEFDTEWIFVQCGEVECEDSCDCGRSEVRSVTYDAEEEFDEEEVEVETDVYEMAGEGYGDVEKECPRLSSSVVLGE